MDEVGPHRVEEPQKAAAMLAEVALRLAAILGSQDVEAWIIGIVVSGLSVILAAIVWSARG